MLCQCRILAGAALMRWDAPPVARDSRLLRNLRSSDSAFNWRECNSPEILCGIAIKELDAVRKGALAVAYALAEAHLSNNAGGGLGTAAPMPYRESGTNEQLTAHLNGSPMTVQAGCSGGQQGERAILTIFASQPHQCVERKAGATALCLKSIDGDNAHSRSPTRLRGTQPDCNLRWSPMRGDCR